MNAFFLLKKIQKSGRMQEFRNKRNLYQFPCKSNEFQLTWGLHCSCIPMLDLLRGKQDCWP